MIKNLSKLKQSILAMAIAAATIIMPLSPVYAADTLDRPALDVSQKSSITVQFMFDNNKTPIASAEFAAAKAASVDSEGTYTWVSSGEKVKSGLSVDESMTKAAELAKSMKAEYTGLTSSSGSVTFSNLEPGLYVIWQTGRTGDALKYSSVDPFLVSAPEYNKTEKKWNNTVTAYPKTQVYTTHISVSKTDENNKELSGAKLNIVDKSGNVYLAWTSSSVAKEIYSIPVGSYTLKEVSAPNGYEVAQDIAFEVKDTDKKQEIKMVDKKTPPKTEEPVQNNSQPKPTETVESKATGDASNVVMYAGIAAAAVGALMIALAMRKKKQ